MSYKNLKINPMDLLWFTISVATTLILCIHALTSDTNAAIIAPILIFTFSSLRLGRVCYKQINKSF